MTSPPRVAIIGNSFIGALMRAYSAAPSEFCDLEIGFGAAAGVNFAKIDVIDDHFVNLRTAGDTALGPLSSYGIVFVYATFPYPAEVFSLHRSMTAQGYSAAVVEASLRDFLYGSDAYRVFSLIRAATPSPVCILSGNTRSTLPAPAPGTVAKGQQLIADYVGSPYLAAPSSLFLPDGTPDLALYTGSVNVLGRAAKTDAEQAKFDVHHFNPRGGRIMLDAIVARARTDLGC